MTFATNNHLRLGRPTRRPIRLQWHTDEQRLVQPKSLHTHCSDKRRSDTQTGGLCRQSLAWDVFFAVSVLLAALTFEGSKLAVLIRYVLLASGILALIGLAGVPTGNMQIRNIGIVGCAPVFLAATAPIASLFLRTPAAVFTP